MHETFAFLMHLAPATLYLFAAGLLLLGVVWRRSSAFGRHSDPRKGRGTKRNGGAGVS